MDKINIFYFFLPLFVIAQNEPKCLKWCYQYDKRVKNKVCCKFEQKNEQNLNNETDFNECPQSCYHDNIISGARQCLSDRMCREYEKCCKDVCSNYKVYNYCKPKFFPIEDEETTTKKTTISTVVTPLDITTKNSNDVKTTTTEKENITSSEKVTEFKETVKTSKPTGGDTTESSMKSSTTPQIIETSTSNSINTLDSEVPKDGFCPVSCVSSDVNSSKQKCEKDTDCPPKDKCCPDSCYPNIKFCKEAVKSPVSSTSLKTITEDYITTISSNPQEDVCPETCTPSIFIDKERKCENDAECVAKEKCCPDSCYPNTKFCKETVKMLLTTKITESQEFDSTSVSTENINGFCPATCSAEENNQQKNCKDNTECAKTERCCPDTCYPHIKFCKIPIENLQTTNFLNTKLTTDATTGKMGSCPSTCSREDLDDTIYDCNEDNDCPDKEKCCPGACHTNKKFCKPPVETTDVTNDALVTTTDLPIVTTIESTVPQIVSTQKSTTLDSLGITTTISSITSSGFCPSTCSQEVLIGIFDCNEDSDCLPDEKCCPGVCHKDKKFCKPRLETTDVTNDSLVTTTDLPIVTTIESTLPQIFSTEKFTTLDALGNTTTISSTTSSGFCPSICSREDLNDSKYDCNEDNDCPNKEKCCPGVCYKNKNFCKPPVETTTLETTTISQPVNTQKSTTLDSLSVMTNVLVTILSTPELLRSTTDLLTSKTSTAPSIQHEGTCPNNCMENDKSKTAILCQKDEQCSQNEKCCEDNCLSKNRYCKLVQELTLTTTTNRITTKTPEPQCPTSCIEDEYPIVCYTDNMCLEDELCCPDNCRKEYNYCRVVQ